MVEFYSKALCRDILKYSKSFSTSAGIGVPSTIKTAEENIQVAFLRAFWDDEGAICNAGGLLGV